MMDNPYAPPATSSVEETMVDDARPGHIRRLAAIVADGCALCVLLIVLGAVKEQLQAYFLELDAASSIPLLKQVMAVLISPGWWVVIVLGYGTGFESSGWQATPGKRVFGLMVCDRRQERLKWPAALGRNVVKLLSFVTCNLLLIPVIFRSRRGVWDFLAGCRVRYEPGFWARRVGTTEGPE